jgi:hypothetical protein
LVFIVQDYSLLHVSIPIPYTTQIIKNNTASNEQTNKQPTKTKTTTKTMKLNQATAAAAFLSVSTATLASSSAASTSSYDELKDKVEPLLASRPKHYLHRMLQGFSDECFADWLDTESYPASNDVSCPEALTVVGDTVTMDFNACDASFREACTADNGKLERR